MGFKLPVDNPWQSHDGHYNSGIVAIYQSPNKSFMCEQKGPWIQNGFYYPFEWSANGHYYMSAS